MKPYHVVITTIGAGDILPALTANLRNHDRLDTTVVWIVADRKTPLACSVACKEMAKNGLDVRYLDPSWQDFLGSKCPAFYERLPWNTDARRNIGYLAALQAGCEWLILLDDDNYPGKDDLIGWHVKDGYLVETENQYANYMANMAGLEIYFPRGYPYSNRGAMNYYEFTSAEVKVGASLGLWTGWPDIDAMTGLIMPGLRSAGPDLYNRLALPARTWTPINSQNTAIRREFIPAAMFVPQWYDGGDRLFDRYGDIFAGYFLQAIMQWSDYRVAFGRPVVEHRRNPHNLLDDMRKEHHAILLLEYLLPRLREFEPLEETITGQVRDLVWWLRDLEDVPAGYAQWIEDTAPTLDAWVDACEAMGA